MIQEGSRLHLEVAPWLTIIPGIVLTVTVLAFLFIADAVRDLLDPREAKTYRGGPHPVESSARRMNTDD
jgi:peptide/nickel transport system permease protein